MAKHQTICIFTVLDTNLWTRCPCGSKVGKSPSPFIARVLQDLDLPWMCQNYKYGCREIKINSEDLEYHNSA